jgi:hypothetical protein
MDDDNCFKQPLQKTKTAQFGTPTDEATADAEKSLDKGDITVINSLDKSDGRSRKLNFKKEVEVVYVKSYKEFNVQVINEKADQLCGGGCNKCIIF